MSREKKTFSPYTYLIYDPRDLSRKWFVRWKEPGGWKRKQGEINTHHTYADRWAAAQSLIAKLSHCHTAKPSTTKAEALVRTYIDNNKTVWRKKTFQQYSSIANVFFEYLNGREPSPKLCEAFMLDIRKTRHAITHNKYRNRLNHLLSKVGQSRLFVDVPTLKAESKPARYFQTYQAERLGKVMEQEHTQLWRFVQFVYFCFIRPGELRQLKASDVLLDEKQIRVPGEISKNRKTQYVIIPDAFDVSWIYELSPDDYLFNSPRDSTQQIGQNYMYNQHLKLLKAMNFGKGYTLYSWKHTGAVYAAKAGVSLKELQLQLRHHSLDETDRYLRQLGVKDIVQFKTLMPGIIKQQAAA